MRDELDQTKRKFIGSKTIRLDNSPVSSAVDERPAGGGLLDLFRAWVKKSPQDRRSTPRHSTADYRIWLGWWNGEEAFFANPARLMNISRGGALIVVSNPPPEGFPAYICLGEPDPSECLESTVLEVRTARRRDCYVRLAFHSPCPSTFFQAAVCMVSPQKARKESATGTSDDER